MMHYELKHFSNKVFANICVKSPIVIHVFIYKIQLQIKVCVVPQTPASVGLSTSASFDFELRSTKINDYNCNK